MAECVKNLKKHNWPEPPKVYDPKMVKNVTFWHLLALFWYFLAISSFRPKITQQTCFVSFYHTLHGFGEQGSGGGVSGITSCVWDWKVALKPRPGSTEPSEMNIIVTGPRPVNVDVGSEVPQRRPESVSWNFISR